MTGKPVHKPNTVPESFRLLVQELRRMGLNLERNFTLEEDLFYVHHPAAFFHFLHPTLMLLSQATLMSRFTRDFACPMLLGLKRELAVLPATGLSPSGVQHSTASPSKTKPSSLSHNPVSLRFRLFPFHSPLLGESLLLSPPPATKMFQFAGLSLVCL